MNKVKGTYDVLPQESYKWQALEEKIRTILKLYHIKEMRTPIMEYSDVFHRNSEASDMVTKETYDFMDRGNRSVTLRPEGTAGIIRSFVEHKLYASGELEKVYYMGPNFRYERPQKGRYRQFYQFGIEAIGSLNPSLDAETIMLAYDFIERLGLKGVKVKINSLGDVTSQQKFREHLTTYFAPHIDHLCSDCQKRLTKNPLRILDCKIDGEKPFVKEAPSPLDFLSDEALTYFMSVKSHLDYAQIDYKVAPKLVRGLDYYSHTVFEVEADIEGFGAQNVLGGGGRYQNLVKDLGGPDLGGIGFAFGMERLLMALEAESIELSLEDTVDVYIITFQDIHHPQALDLLYQLRKENIISDMNYTQKSFKGQLKHALRLGAKYLLILGEEELKNGVIGIKDTQTEAQENVPLHLVIAHLKKLLER